MIQSSPSSPSSSHLTAFSESTHALVPMNSIGPLKIIGPHMDDEVMVPLATYESPLWPSTNRGAKATRLSGGVEAVLISAQMTRSILVQAPNAAYAKDFLEHLKKQKETLKDIVANTSRFAELIDWHPQILGKMIYLRFALKTGDASGHNMVTKAADALLKWILEQYPDLKHLSVSGNFCVDKKVSAVNGILGRGKNVVAE
ncbi:3-hydroxy-3-methylglutaryl-coenzyme A reductase, partial [Stylophora pistillata]